MQDNVLKSVETILKNYQSIELERDPYNIFWLLRIERKELIHSRFIANLLNNETKMHKNGQRHFQLLIDTINEEILKSSLDNQIIQLSFIDKNDYKIKTEYSIGRITRDYENGGLLDLIAYSENECFIIENKIDAEDQEKQLIRYNNYIKNKNLKGILIYLTKFGTEPSEKSTKLRNKLSYICVSYKNTVLKWMYKCLGLYKTEDSIYKMIDQYINVCKSLTGQFGGREMNQEIVDDICKSSESIISSFNIINNAIEIKKRVISEYFIPKIKSYSSDLTFLFEGFDSDELIPSKRVIGDQWWGFVVKKNDREYKNVKIRFEFEDDSFFKMNCSLRIINQKDKNIRNKRTFEWNNKYFIELVKGEDSEVIENIIYYVNILLKEADNFENKTIT